MLATAQARVHCASREPPLCALSSLAGLPLPPKAAMAAHEAAHQALSHLLGPPDLVG
jgi:hypothetical protein